MHRLRRGDAGLPFERDVCHSDGLLLGTRSQGELHCPLIVAPVENDPHRFTRQMGDQELGQLARVGDGFVAQPDDNVFRPQAGDLLVPFNDS